MGDVQLIIGTGGTGAVAITTPEQARELFGEPIRSFQGDAINLTAAIEDVLELARESKVHVVRIAEQNSQPIRQNYKLCAGAQVSPGHDAPPPPAARSERIRIHEDAFSADPSAAIRRAEAEGAVVIVDRSGRSVMTISVPQDDLEDPRVAELETAVRDRDALLRDILNVGEFEGECTCARCAPLVSRARALGIGVAP